VIDATRFFIQLGRRIRHMRESHHFTLEDMISYGFSARHWQQIEKGRPTTCTTILRVSLIFNVSFSQMVRGLPAPTHISLGPQRKARTTGR